LLFGVVQDAKIAKTFKLKDANDIVILKPNDRPISFSSNTYDINTVRNWIEQNRKPVWEELNFANIYSIWQGLPNFIAFVNNVDSEVTKKALSVFTNLAKEYAKSQKLSFVVINGDNFKEFVSSLGLEREDLPTFAIINSAQQTEYFYPKDTHTISLSSAKRWIDMYLANKLEAKQRDLYSDQDSVLKLNSENWESEVLNPEKDVLVEFYENKCHFCKVMAPHYKALGNLMSTTKDVVVAVFDTSKSRPSESLNISSIPTLLFFPSDNKTPIPYDEAERDVQSLYNFIKNKQTKLSEDEITKINNIIEMANSKINEEESN
jgi:thiol-disulfide isomerase/thioredoxin